MFCRELLRRREERVYTAQSHDAAYVDTQISLETGAHTSRVQEKQ